MGTQLPESKTSRHDRVFPFTKHFFEKEMIRGTKDGEVKKKVARFKTFSCNPFD